MTERLYYNDSYLTQLEASGDRIYLDRTAFYPTSGGQPFDTGLIAGARVLDVIDAESSTIDLDTPSLNAGQVRAAELRANQAVFANHPVTATFADNSEDLGLRKTRNAPA